MRYDIFLNSITPESLHFDTSNIAGVLKINDFIQGTVSVKFYEPETVIPFSKNCSLLELKKLYMLLKFQK